MPRRGKTYVSLKTVLNPNVSCPIKLQNVFSQFVIICPSIDTVSVEIEYMCTVSMSSS